MRKPLYILAAVLCAILFFGAKKTELGKLQPVELVMVTAENGKIRIQTDTGDGGAGRDFPSALNALKEHSPKKVFLNTADYLLLSPGAVSELFKMGEVLRPGIQVAFLSGEAEPEEAAAYLAGHKSYASLKDVLTGKPAPVLRKEKLGYKLME